MTNNLEQFQIENLVNKYHIDKKLNVEICTHNDVHIIRQNRPFNITAYYAAIDENPVAYCAGRNENHRSGQRFLITSTFVHPSFRRQGIARAIYLAIIDSGIKLVSDWELSDSAIALWSNLMATEPLGDIFPFQGGFIGRRRKSSFGMAQPTGCFQRKSNG